MSKYQNILFVIAVAFAFFDGPRRVGAEDHRGPEPVPDRPDQEAKLGESATPEAVISEARRAAQKLFEITKAPGMTVAAAVGDRIVWSEAFGFSDRENQISATKKTLFRVGSLSKLLTIAAAVRLYELGRLDIDAPVGRYLPGYPDARGRITVRRLAGHLAGIRHYNTMAEFLAQSHCQTTLQAIDTFKNDPLLHEPGTKYSYSSHGYVLLGGVLEVSAGMDFPKAIEAFVLAPLSLSSTMLDVANETVPNRSSDYSLRNGTVVLAPKIDLSCRRAAGGYLSTAEDLAQLAAAHTSGVFIKPETQQLLFTSMKLPDGSETGVGLGWRISKDEAGRVYVHHGGNIAGGRAFVLLYPETRIAVAVCTNLGDAPFAQREVLAIALPFAGTEKSP